MEENKIKRVKFECKAEYGNRIPYSIFKKHVIAGSHIQALRLFKSIFFKTFPGGEKGDPDRIVITNMSSRIRITIDVDKKTNPKIWSLIDTKTELVAECIRPDEVEFPGNRHTDRGEELEPEARDLFARLMNLIAESEVPK